MSEKLSDTFKKYSSERHLIGKIRYYSQWESPELIKKIINDDLSAKDDPLWERSGASNREEYEFWSKNMCGMACLKMVLEHELNYSSPIITLGKDCAAFGGYIVKNDSIDGLFYKPFLEFIKHKFGLKGKIVSPMNMEDIIKEIERDNYVITSVSHKIRDPNTTPVKTGGHLVLILGFDGAKNTLIFHNPSGDKPENQHYSEIHFNDFSRFFAQRGIVIHKSSQGK